MAAVGTAVVFWSIGNMIVRDASLTGPQIAFWRYLVASLLYAVGHLVWVGPLTMKDFVRAAPTGIVLALEIAAFFVAIKTTTVANTTVIGALVPLLLFGVASRRFNENVSARVVGATLVAVLGVGAVVFGSTGETIWSPRGDALAVVALSLFAAYFALGKIARESLDGITLQTHTLLAGTPILLIVLLADSGGVPTPSGGEWLSVLGLVLFPSTGHFLVNWAHRHVTLTLVSMATLAVPVLSVIGAALLFDEQLVTIQVVGIGLVLAVLAFAIVETNRLVHAAPPAISPPAASTNR